MALTPGPIQSFDAGGGYQYVYKIDENGNAGVDYFLQGRPITNAEFAQGTGQDTGVIENTAAGAVPDMLERSNPDGGYTYADPNAPVTETKTNNTSGGTAPATFQPVSYNGQLYYTAADYAAAVTEHITQSYNDSIKKIENNFKNGFITLDEKDAEIKKVRTDLIKKKDEDMASISGYMNSISPDAIQSGRGKLEGKAVESYTSSNKQLGSELGANLYDASGRIRQDLNANDLAPYMTQLSDTGNFARSISGNYQLRDTNKEAANASLNSGLDQNANDYISNSPNAGASNYSNYLNSNILNNKKPAMAGVGSFSSVAKVDKYGNPIDEYVNR